ncbi:NUDIX hydrolase [Candidatus Poriferisocius sp.]|uniref:NUDIX hydrolase n=1 Tax=Candidatus Poriferisocius sp. TaxID=3101276 RepID=UPI003B01CCBE
MADATEADLDLSGGLWLGQGDVRLAPTTDLAAARRLLAGFDDSLGDSYRALIDDHPDACRRMCRPGHLTGSALVVDHEGDNTLLLLHAKLGLWLQPGGHADGDANLVAVALREAAEETGIKGLRIWSNPLHLDIHRVDPPDEDPHLHYDVRFLVRAPVGALPRANHESMGMRWVPLNRLSEFGCDPGLIHLAELGARALKEVPRF